MKLYVTDQAAPSDGVWPQTWVIEAPFAETAEEDVLALFKEDIKKAYAEISFGQVVAQYEHELADYSEVYCAVPPTDSIEVALFFIPLESRVPPIGQQVIIIEKVSAPGWEYHDINRAILHAVNTRETASGTTKEFEWVTNEDENFTGNITHWAYIPPLIGSRYTKN